MLVVWNVAAFIALVLATILLHEISFSRTYWYVLRVLLTFVLAMIVTVVVWHRGFVRAYAIGLLVGLVVNGFGGVISMAGRYGGSDARAFMIGNLAIAMICGLLCAGYVRLLETSRGEKTKGSGLNAE
jgi:hypothetical protein